MTFIQDSYQSLRVLKEERWLHQYKSIYTSVNSSRIFSYFEMNEDSSFLTTQNVPAALTGPKPLY